MIFKTIYTEHVYINAPALKNIKPEFINDNERVIFMNKLTLIYSNIINVKNMIKAKLYDDFEKLQYLPLKRQKMLVKYADKIKEFTMSSTGCS